MERLSKFRATMLLVIFAVILGAFALKLYDLQSVPYS